MLTTLQLVTLLYLHCYTILRTIYTAEQSFIIIIIITHLLHENKSQVLIINVIYFTFKFHDT